MQTQAQFLDIIQLEAKDILEKADREYSNFSAEVLNWKPAPKRWSIGEILDHIINSNKDYLISVDKAIKTGTPLNGEEVMFRHTLLGNWMINQVGPEIKMKMPTPKLFRPASSNIEIDIMSRFKVQHEKILNYIEKAKSINISQSKIYSPVTRLMKFNLGDTFGILVYHTTRHFNQIDRTMKLYEMR